MIFRSHPVAAAFLSFPDRHKWGFPKIRGPYLGVLMIRILVFWGLFWVPLFRKAPNLAASLDQGAVDMCAVFLESASQDACAFIGTLEQRGQ